MNRFYVFNVPALPTGIGETLPKVVGTTAEGWGEAEARVRRDFRIAPEVVVVLSFSIQTNERWDTAIEL